MRDDGERAAAADFARKGVDDESGLVQLGIIEHGTAVNCNAEPGSRVRAGRSDAADGRSSSAGRADAEQRRDGTVSLQAGAQSKLPSMMKQLAKSFVFVWALVGIALAQSGPAAKPKAPAKTGSPCSTARTSPAG